MKNLTRCLAALLVGSTFVCMAAAQQSQGSTTIPKVLHITREYTKPGKAGMIHDQKESAFVQAMARAKWPTHYYLGMTSLSGKQRALFLASYDSFDALEKDSAGIAKNNMLSAALDRAGAADGELLDSMDEGIFLLQEDMSLRPKADLSPMRFMEFSMYHVKPGHGKEWRELVKMVIDGYTKAVPDAHWGCFQEMYGGDGGTYLFITGRKSLAEIDSGVLEDKKFGAAMGEEGLKKLEELVAASVESSQQQLFAIDPQMSYVKQEWIKAAPEFWMPKAAASAAAAEEKKAKP
jgi:hypothetical protein